MSSWDLYQKRLNVRGTTKRDELYKREIRYLRNKIPENLSYKTLDVYGQDSTYNITEQTATQQEIAVIDSDNLEEKYLYSMPEEDIENGAIVYWHDCYWVVTERDANEDVYVRAKMVQCNFLLKWLDHGSIMEQWCRIEDGTKYLVGELEDRQFVTTRGDSRISMTITRNKYTVNFNRENRFLIDDPDTKHKLSYQLTKPLKLGMAYNGKGVYKFVLQEVTATEYDNHELGIADYYKDTAIDISDERIDEKTGKRVWL